MKLEIIHEGRQSWLTQVQKAMLKTSSGLYCVTQNVQVIPQSLGILRVTSPFKANAAFRFSSKGPSDNWIRRCVFELKDPPPACSARWGIPLQELIPRRENARGADAKTSSADQAVCLANLCFDLRELAFLKIASFADCKGVERGQLQFRRKWEEHHWVHFTKDPLQTFNQNEFLFSLIKADKLHEKVKPFISATKTSRFGEH